MIRRHLFTSAIGILFLQVPGAGYATQQYPLLGTVMINRHAPADMRSPAQADMVVAAPSTGVTAARLAQRTITMLPTTITTSAIPQQCTTAGECEDWAECTVDQVTLNGVTRRLAELLSIGCDEEPLPKKLRKRISKKVKQAKKWIRKAAKAARGRNGKRAANLKARATRPLDQIVKGVARANISDPCKVILAQLLQQRIELIDRWVLPGMLLQVCRSYAECPSPLVCVPAPLDQKGVCAHRDHVCGGVAGLVCNCWDCLEASSCCDLLGVCVTSQERSVICESKAAAAFDCRHHRR